MQQTHLFATSIQHERLSYAKLLQDLSDACWMIEDGDTAGHEWCEREGYPGYTSYASLDDLPDRAPAFADLVKQLDALAYAFAKARYWDLGTAKLQCDSLWVNILGAGGHHSGHIHPNSVISGTCYVAMPEGSGRIKFEDPRLPMMMAAPPRRRDAAPRLSQFHYVAPKIGDVLLWESWLRHEVPMNVAEEERVSGSFNYAWVTN